MKSLLFFHPCTFTTARVISLSGSSCAQLVVLSPLSFIHVARQTFEDESSHSETEQSCIINILIINHAAFPFSFPSFLLHSCFSHMKNSESTHSYHNPPPPPLPILFLPPPFFLSLMNGVSEIENETLHPVTKHCSTNYSYSILLPYFSSMYVSIHTYAKLTDALVYCYYFLFDNSKSVIHVWNKFRT